jgi:hypothetical protein
MIRYAIKDQDLRARIDAAVQKKKPKQTWAKLTRRPGGGKKVQALWSLAKPAYLELQQGKCGFCERMLGQDERLPYEKDVEHFRPKKRLDPWPPADKKHWPLDLPASLPKSPHRGKGWAHLAYHPWNYLISCKECNQRLKRNFFPTAGRPDFTAKGPQGLAAHERPYLVYPLHDATPGAGTFNADPRELFAWESGIYLRPAAKNKKSHAYLQALVTIAFFGLNDGANTDRLLNERAYRLKTIGLLLEKYERTPGADAATDFWNKQIMPETSPGLAHTACVESILQLYKSNRTAAIQQIEMAVQMLAKLPPPTVPVPAPRRRR